jgi:hypothetical protein
MSGKLHIGGSAPENLPGHSLDEWEENVAEFRAATASGPKRTVGQFADKFWSRKNAAKAAAAVRGAPAVAGDDTDDLVPEPTTEADKWKKFHGKYYGRAK